MDAKLLIFSRLIAFAVVMCLSESTTWAQSSIDQSRPAYLGQSASGGGVDNAEFNLALVRTRRLASEYHHELMTTEHLLLALLDELSAQELLDFRGIDIPVIRSQLEAHLHSLPESAVPGVDPLPHPLMRQAIAKAYMEGSRRSEKALSGAAVVVAIAEMEKTYASKVLIGEGATFAVLAPELSKMTQERKRQRDSNLAILEGKFSTIAPGVIKSGQGADGISPQGVDEYKNYLLRVVSTSGEPVKFKAAVSHDGQLDLYIEDTPFQVDLLVKRLAALFETIEDGAKIRVELIGDVAGKQRVVAGFGGESGALFQDPYLHGSQCSGHL